MAEDERASICRKQKMRGLTIVDHSCTTSARGAAAFDHVLIVVCESRKADVSIRQPAWSIHQVCENRL
jgi:hypothetical protein